MKAYMGSIVPPIIQFAKSEISPTTAQFVQQEAETAISHSSRSAPQVVRDDESIMSPIEIEQLALQFAQQEAPLG